MGMGIDSGFGEHPTEELIQYAERSHVELKSQLRSGYDAIKRLREQYGIPHVQGRDVSDFGARIEYLVRDILRSQGQ
jgi:nitrogenase molybdenum-iron protein alpha/beta subunit